jgi:hypothetical protein
MSSGVNPNQEFLSDFLVCRLHSLLTRELGCGSFATDQHIAWFVREARYFPPQKDQHSFNQFARDEVIAHVGKRLKKVEPSKIEAELPAKWSPCKFWNNAGDRECDNCTRGYAGSMVKADALWRENHKFVLWYVGIVLSRRGQHAPPEVREDIAGLTWHRVAQTIHLYRDPGNGTQRRQWLKNAVDWTVSDYFRDITRAKRDSRQEVSFEALEAS